MVKRKSNGKGTKWMENYSQDMKHQETGNDTEEKKESGSTLIFGLFHLIGFFNVKQKRALGALRKISVFSMFDVSLTATATVGSK